MSPRAMARRLARESGQTIVELSVAMLIFGIIMAAFLGIMVWVQTALVRETTRSTSVDQVRLATEAIDREVRSGNILCEVSGYYGLSVYTQSNGTTRWVQYRVSSQNLQRREYSAGAWTSWRTIASGIVNPTPVGMTTDVPFKLDTSTAAGGRVVDVVFLVDSDTTDSASNTVRVESSIAIRNQSTVTPCSALPSG